MKFCNKYLLLLVGIIGTIGTANAAHSKRPWTVIIYVAADNNLNPEADYNIAQMVKASATNNVYILVYLNIKRSGQAKMTQKLVIQNGKISYENVSPAQDSGSADTLIKALTWAVTEYPSDHIFVDLWNHGSGSLNRMMHEMHEHRGVCYDDSTGHYMTDVDYKRAFDLIVNQYLHGKKFDIISFDACLMADIEVAFTLMSYANYVVSSQETVPGTGFNYTDLLKPFAKSAPDALTIAKNLVKSYDSNYKPSGQSYTLSAINLDHFSPVVAATNSVAQILSQLLDIDKQGLLEQAITDSQSSSACPHFDEPTYIDLYTFYANLYNKVDSAGLGIHNQAQLKAALRNALAAITKSIVANVRSNDFSKVHGLSIYFADTTDGIEPSYGELYWTKINPQWLSFLSAYMDAASSAA